MKGESLQFTHLFLRNIKQFISKSVPCSTLIVNDFLKVPSSSVGHLGPIIASNYLD